MQDLLQSFRLSVRALGRAPGFTLTAVAALALGIGGSTVVFSVVNTLLLRPLPYAAPERLVVSEPGPPWELYQEWRTAHTVFEGMAAYNERAANVAGVGEAERIMMARVTPTFLSVVGTRPAIGRGFDAREIQAGQDKVVVLTDAFWRRHYRGSRGVLGRALTLDDQPYTIIGVLPPEFQTPMQLVPARGLSFDWGAAVLVPLLSDPLRTREPASTDRFWRGMHVIARLRPGVSLERARAAASTLSTHVKLPSYFKGEYTLVRLTDFVAGGLPAQLAILAAAVGLLLLVACANVANLLLARGTARRRELATRAALGATTPQLVRHMLTETVLLGLAGGIAGVVAAGAGVKAVATFGGPVLARLDGVAIDGRVLAFAAAASLGVGLLVGLVPALRLSRSVPAVVLRVARGYTPEEAGRMPLPSILVVVEVVLSLALVVGAGLLAKDFAAMLSRDLGFRPDGVLTADVSLSRIQYRNRAQLTAFFEDLLSRSAALPGVTAVALSTIAPAGSAVMSIDMRVEGATRGAHAGDAGGLGPDDHEYSQVVGGEYFRALSIPILEGRGFGVGDTASAGKVAVVNEAFARKYWGSPRAAVNHRLMLDTDFHTIVGVTGDLHDVGSASPPLALVYFVLPQSPITSSQMTLILKGRSDALALVAPVTRLVRAMNPNQPLYNVLTLDRIVSTQLARQRLMASMMTVFGVLALLLAAVGVYGVMSYSVAQRNHELGVRLALGGSRTDMFKLVVGRGMRMVVAGVVLGLAAAYGLARLLASQLVGVTRTDPATYATMAVAVALLGLAGCAAPAWRATRVDPLTTLRGE